MKPKQYIVTTNDRIKILKEKALQQQNRAETQRIRYTVNNRPSIKTLESTERKHPELNTTQVYYQQLYTQEGK